MDFFYVVLGGFFGEGLDFGEGDGFDDVGECHCQKEGECGGEVKHRGIGYHSVEMRHFYGTEHHHVAEVDFEADVADELCDLVA